MYPKEDPCLRICPHPQEGYFAAGFASGIIRIFDVYNTSIKDEMKWHERSISALEYSPDSALLVAADVGSNYCIYDAKRGYEPVKVLDRQIRSKTQNQHVSFTSDSRFFAVISDSGTHFSIYSCSSYKLMKTTFVPNSQIDKLVFSPLNELLVLCANCSLKIYRVEAEPVLVREVPPLHRTRVHGLAFSPNVNYLATIGADSLLKIWDYEWNKEHQVFVGHVTAGNAVVWSEDRLFSAGIF
jgi:WD40 repeat protein